MRGSVGVPQDEAKKSLSRLASAVPTRSVTAMQEHMERVNATEEHKTVMDINWQYSR